MRFFFLLFIGLFSLNLTACNETRHPNTENESSRTLIIFYDPTKTDAKELISQSQRLHTTLVYQYQNFNAIAVNVPPAQDMEETKARFEALPSVLQVNEDQKLSYIKTLLLHKKRGRNFAL
ncbi:hypothetical protein [Caviibacterium pharyngocola]|uniref:Inhibitor I9 domain-containing protein n=1 Tax=Caviibacterium pharyngocola TaxID=28159 RepID=A0A2M8RSM1_9PAST|nr:hypothetical protein [Caviibacterium pharyngocola]PJG81886.1 hypothetical protein CVP04_12115 [Caviibacterium pharyngocola]